MKEEIFFPILLCILSLCVLFLFLFEEDSVIINPEPGVRCAKVEGFYGSVAIDCWKVN